MARPSTPGGLRQRNVASAKKTDPTAPVETDYSKLAKDHQSKAKVDKERDYQIAFVVITILAFVTRFWGISHPNEVVFDEVHFGKVSCP
jgi:dolichyl-phosphate-mannose-protein mannosyltransferase